VRHRQNIEPVAVPDLLFYEAANTLALTSRLRREEAQAAMDKLARARLDAYAPDRVSVQRAMTLARQARISAYDATYVALAERLECDFVTADMKLVRKAGDVELACAVFPLLEEKP
jgi:predicted nucleic acid-binding protein